MSTAKAVQPGEWEPHTAVWTAWPSDADLWRTNLPGAREEFTALCNAIADVDPITGMPRGEHLHILASGDEAVQSARAALNGPGITIHPCPFGDIWLRDTAPIFVRVGGGLHAMCFMFNGWGGKYVLDHDDEVAPKVAALANISATHHNWVLEGGSIDVDGLGSALTTRQCLLNPNRNPSMTQAAIEAELASSLGIRNLIWLDDGLENDHTDGHIDNLARFIAPGVIACMEARTPDDPNKAVYEAVIQTLTTAVDAEGHQFKVVRLPSPGKITGEEGEIVPASHMNFYISNTRVIVPLYNSPWDKDLLSELRPHFPGREVIGLPARNILTGGGSFHCITQQQPIEQ